MKISPIFLGRHRSHCTCAVYFTRAGNLWR